MSELEQHIKRVNDKLQFLLKQHLQLQKDNEKQSRQIKELLQVKAKDQEQLAALQEQVLLLKAATGKMDDPDKKALEKHISRYIREIDKCIGLLSD